MATRARLTAPDWDQGSEMALHHEIGTDFADGVHFAFPGSPKRRGSSENANGLLRQYFPSGPTCQCTALTS
jgi:IS30 family transposase